MGRRINFWLGNKGNQRTLQFKLQVLVVVLLVVVGAFDSVADSSCAAAVTFVLQTYKVIGWFIRTMRVVLVVPFVYKKLYRVCDHRHSVPKLVYG